MSYVYNNKVNSYSLKRLHVFGIAQQRQFAYIFLFFLLLSLSTKNSLPVQFIFNYLVCKFNTARRSSFLRVEKECRQEPGSRARFARLFPRTGWSGPKFVWSRESSSGDSEWKQKCFRGATRKTFPSWS